MKALPGQTSFLRPAVLSILLSGGLGILSSSHAAVNFVFNFTDAPGFGFNAAGQTGLDRQAGLAQAADYVGSFLANYNATINIDVNGSVTNDTTLASASSNYNAPYPGEGFGFRGDIMTKILTGVDPSAGADGQVNWNFEDFSWEPLSDFQAGELDLISTGIHELTHALGFASGIFQDGSDSWGNAIGSTSAWTPFDQFVADSTGNLINNMFEMDISRWNTASVGGDGELNGLFFNGMNAMAANGGNLVRLYSPTTYSSGSSGSHLDTNFYTGSAENLMNHASSVAEGLDFRNYTAIELGILRDIGYVDIIPETSSSLLGIFGAVFLLNRRRRSC